MPIELYPHQIDAVNRMKNGCILCGGVGSGKSLTALAYYYLQQDGTPATLLGGEYEPMGDPPQDLYIITTARKRDTFEWDKELVKFALSPAKEGNLYCNKVVVDSWNNITKYTAVKDAFFIFDEQRVVGSGAWVKSFLKIAKANRWILLSATPGDSWQDYIPVFIANGFYKNRTEFRREHVVYSAHSQYPKIERYLNTGRLIRLRDKILVTMDFDRETVAHHQDIWLPYDALTYKTFLRERWDTQNDRPFQSAAELCYALRQVVNADASRGDTVLELLQEHPKMIIFYNFDYELDILRALPYDKDVEIAEWNGHKHQPVPESAHWVYLVQYTAGCEGWNCIRTDTILFYSQNYSYKVMKQATGRIDRLNTPYTDLYYYHLKSRSSIDMAISRALADKKNFNEGRFIR